MHPARIRAAPKAQSNETTLCASLELSRKTWLLTVLAPGIQKVSKFSTRLGNGGALIDLLGRLRSKAERGPVGIGGGPGRLDRFREE
jgi:hypothetical protein